MPTFTILIATYNAASLLPRTLGSLATQTCRDFNVIIQDGASSDDTVAVAQSYTDKVPVLLLESEKDTGIYDAWNKALDRWQNEVGAWVLFLGAGDILDHDKVLEMVFQILTALPIEVVYASASLQLVRKDGSCSDRLRACLLAKSPRLQLPPHPALFHRKTLFSKNRFDTSFVIAGDTEFLLRTWPTHKDVATIIPFVVTRMLRGGISDNPKAIGRIRYEVLRAKMMHCQMPFATLCAEIVGILKGYIIVCIYKLFGKSAPSLLNYICALFGKKTVWKHNEL